jgi:hypothetical protein
VFSHFKEKKSTLGLYEVKQFDYDTLSINFDLKKKQNIELQFNRGRIIFNKSLIFGYASNFEAFIPSTSKQCLFISPTFFKSNIWKSIDHGVSTLVKRDHPHLRMDNSFGNDRPFGWP